VTYAAEVREAVQAAGVAELVWRHPEGAPQAIGVVPLLLGDSPAVALPWAYEATARAVAAADEVALALTEPRLAGSAWRPLALVGRPRLVEDDDGALFTEHLLDQELRKHPPSRLLMDSFLLRREHWWYLPRLVLLVEGGRVLPLAARGTPAEALLAVDDGGLHLATVQVQDWDAEPLTLSGAPACTGAAALVGQEVSVPDAERWTVHVTAGRCTDGQLHVGERPPTRGLEAVPGLRARMRRQRALERACVRALRTAGHG